MHCSFGEKIYYSSRDIEFFLGGYFFMAQSVEIGPYCNRALVSFSEASRGFVSDSWTFLLHFYLLVQRGD